MITSPVFIIGCPRSGTTLLYRMLQEADGLWSIGGESRHIIERHHPPARKGWDSGELTAADVTPTSRRDIPLAFEREAAPASFWRRVNRLRAWLDRRRGWRAVKRIRSTDGPAGRLAGGVPRGGAGAIRWWVRQRHRVRIGRERPKRLLEKTPENCLRLPFLLELFPDATVVFLTRDGRGNVSSLMEGWRRPDLFRGYPVPDRLSVPGVPEDRWAFTLISGWRELVSAPLEEICARQWAACNEAVLNDLENEGRSVPLLTIRFEDLVAEPAATLARVAAHIGVDSPPVGGPLPEANIVSAPGREKWRRLPGDAIGRIEEIIAPTMARLGYGDGENRGPSEER